MYSAGTQIEAKKQGVGTARTRDERRKRKKKKVDAEFEKTPYVVTADLATHGTVPTAQPTVHDVPQNRTRLVLPQPRRVRALMSFTTHEQLL